MVGRFFESVTRSPRKEPDYIGTFGYDGRKYIIFEKFFNNAKVQRQLEQLPKAIESRLKRAGTQ